MAVDTLEKLLRQADHLTPDEQLLLASRLIERVRQMNKPLTGKDLLNSKLVGCGQKEKTLTIALLVRTSYVARRSLEVALNDLARHRCHGGYFTGTRNFR